MLIRLKCAVKHLLTDETCRYFVQKVPRDLDIAKNIEIKRKNWNLSSLCALRSLWHSLSGKRHKWSICGAEKNQNIPYGRRNSDDNAERNILAKEFRFLQPSTYSEVGWTIMQNTLDILSNHPKLQTFRCDSTTSWSWK